jgi:6-phosphofructokinase 1
VMGRYCGYLALMSGLATGAERVYLHEEGIALRDLQTDLTMLLDDIQQGRRLSLMIRNEYANPLYTTSFIAALFEQEGAERFDVRQVILGHLQQGGSPTPFDRIQAIRLATRCVEHLITEAEQETPAGAFIGLQGGDAKIFDLEDMPRMADVAHMRPKEQWWLELQPLVRLLATKPQADG